ncbi:MAG: PspA/IM30 family protein [Planctomycetes bacterium]|nr:PspA/IM30 family protein [Planctomycetota bacterium]MCH9723538.1 PspA/IM30 family protein [Planctomycetota bacterium]MCH9775331.1 PspA/IM30 family protein [Planctomycetota bacterium]MDF1746155.1 PspA/IM30 family protein [Gimesia sp.]
MRIFQRINDIISANIHDMIDQFEDPEIMLKQAIREMEYSIEAVTKDTAKVLAGEKRLLREYSKNEVEANQWQQRAVQAVQNGDDQLARKALTRKKEHESLSQALKEQMGPVKKAGETLKVQLSAMKAKLAEAKRHLTGLLVRKRSAEIRKQSRSSLACAQESAFNANAFRKFDRLREKVEEAESEADALDELHSMTDLTSVELAGQLETDNLAANANELEIDQELNELKSKKE